MADSTATTPSHRLAGRRLLWAILYACVAWLVLTGSLWLATGTNLPTIKIRWASSVTFDQRVQAERELSLVLREHDHQRTGTYFVTRPDAETLKRIVVHPLVEDTAYVNRGVFVLEGAPYARMWIGDRVTLLKQPVLWFLSVAGLLPTAAEAGPLWVAMRRDFMPG